MKKEKQPLAERSAAASHEVPGSGSRRRVVISFPQETKTKQSFKEECDINRIVKSFAKTGEFTHLARGTPQYGYASSQSFHEAMNIVTESKSQFEELPSKARSHFENDPAKFLACCEDETRRDELVELGLADPKPAPEPEPSPEASQETLKPVEKPTEEAPKEDKSEPK